MHLCVYRAPCGELAVPRTASHRGRRTDTARLSGAPYRYPVARKQFAVPSVATGGVVAPRSASQSACGGACGISVAESAVEAVSERDGNRRVLSLAFSRASFSFTFASSNGVSIVCCNFTFFSNLFIFFELYLHPAFLVHIPLHNSIVSLAFEIVGLCGTPPVRNFLQWLSAYCMHSCRSFKTFSYSCAASSSNISWASPWSSSSS